MGKHSARDGQDGREDRTAGAGGGYPGGGYRRPVPPDVPGSGRRRAGDPFADTGGFVIRPQDLDGPPQAHPEHREHTAWGASGGWAAAGTPGRGGVRPGAREPVLDPVESWAEDWAPYDTASALRPPPGSGAPRHMQPAGRGIPRPRQEFVDAFDEPREHTAADEALTGGGPAGSSGQSGASAGSGTGSGSGSGEEPAEEAGKGGGKGRTLSGIAAAAVVTVLAVVATGQLAGGEKKHTAPDGKETANRSTPDEVSRFEVRGQAPAAAPAATPAATATPATYDQLMARLYPLDPRLALSGTFTTVPGHQAAPGRGKVMKFRVDVEKGLPLDADLFSRTVFTTLNDPRSWGHGGTMTFERVSTGPADIVVTLASPGTTAKWCAKSGLDTSVENVSCDAASTPRTMINAYRWAQGAVTYGPARIHAYRQMLINHEVGHRLGHSHVGCPKQGAPAPVMMQQTKFLSLDGGPTCKPNAWPFP